MEWFRKTLLVWASLWMLMVPWVHVHLAVEHEHGGAAHAHHAVTHTIFSASLECEFPTEEDDHCPAGSNDEEQSIGHDSHSFIHSEIDFTFAYSAVAPVSGKSVLALSTLVEHDPSLPRMTPPRIFIPEEMPSALGYLTTALPLRAPPVTSL